MKEKKTPRPKKALSTPAVSSADRRRSGRGTSAQKSYADRDSSEVSLDGSSRRAITNSVLLQDEEEMMEGVSKWKYVDEDSDAEQLSEEENPVGAKSFHLNELFLTS